MRRSTATLWCAILSLLAMKQNLLSEEPVQVETVSQASYIAPLEAGQYYKATWESTLPKTASSDSVQLLLDGVPIGNAKLTSAWDRFLQYTYAQKERRDSELTFRFTSTAAPLVRDFKLERFILSPEVELLPAAGFGTESINLWHFVDYGGKGRHAMTARGDDTSPSGNCLSIATTPGALGSVVTIPLPVRPGGKFTVELWCKSETSKDFLLQAISSWRKGAWTASTRMPLTNTWSKQSWTFEIPESAQDVRSIEIALMGEKLAEPANMDISQVSFKMMERK